MSVKFFNCTDKFSTIASGMKLQEGHRCSTKERKKKGKNKQSFVGKDPEVSGLG